MTVLLSLSIEVGIAVALSILRILIPEIQLWHYLLPGYLIGIIMSYLAGDRNRAESATRISRHIGCA